MRTRPSYVKLAPTQHWRRLPDGSFGRDWIIRDTRTGAVLRGTYAEAAA